MSHSANTRFKYTHSFIHSLKTNKVQKKMNQVLVIHCCSNSCVEPFSAPLNVCSLAKQLLNIDLLPSDDHSFSHTISTKYYNATLHFSVHFLCSDEDRESIFSDWNTDVHPHALIVTFEHFHREIIDALKKCIQRCKSMFNNRLEVCLCVALREYSKETQHNIFTELNEFCIEEQFELILQESTSSEDGNHAEQERHFLKDKFGSERVLEALSSTMWPQMDKPSGQPATATNGQDVTSKNSERKDNEEKYIEQLTDEVFKKEEVGNEEDAEKEMQRFDELLNSMKHMRSMASSMPDEERKKRAAELAMSLFSMLGIEEGEDEEL
jgi:hypothetical protein